MAAPDDAADKPDDAADTPDVSDDACLQGLHPTMTATPDNKGYA